MRQTLEQFILYALTGFAAYTAIKLNGWRDRFMRYMARRYPDTEE
jgi:hypothetical protein